MNHETLKQVIFDQHEIIRSAEIVPRDIDIEENGRYILVGLRRAGKSTILYRIAQELAASGIEWERIIYINFEDERLSEFTSSDFNDILSVQAELSSGKGYFFFDEIQNIAGWEKFARRMADSKEHVWITGSNARMLSRDMETVLGGRYFSLLVHPYSFPEYLSASGIPHDGKDVIGTKSGAVILRAFGEYYIHGGFPESLLYRNKREYVSGVFQKILLGDITVRNNVRNPHAMRLLVKKLAEAVKDEISYTRLHNILRTIGCGISKDSVIDYVGYMLDAYLILPVRNYFASFAEREGSPRYYFSDNGILSLFIDSHDTALLENLVALTLVRRYGEDGVFFLKSAHTGVDVDFYIPETKTAIQAAFSLREISNSREEYNLRKAMHLMPDIEHAMILTYEEEAQLDGIEVLPVWKWLLK